MSKNNSGFSIAEPLEIKKALVEDFDKQSESLKVGEDTEHYELLEEYWKTNSDEHLGRVVGCALEIFDESWRKNHSIFLADGEGYSRECSTDSGEIPIEFEDFYRERGYFSEEFWEGYENEIGYLIPAGN